MRLRDDIALATSARPERRDYGLTGESGAAALAAGLAGAKWYRPPIDPERLLALIQRDNWRPLRDTALWLEGASYALYCLAADDFALTDGLCTHAGTHLADGHLEGSVIECPKHNGRFNVCTGEALRRPTTVPLRCYRVRASGGRVVADLRPGGGGPKAGPLAVIR